MRSMTRKNVNRALPKRIGETSSRAMSRSSTGSAGHLIIGLLYHSPMLRSVHRALLVAGLALVTASAAAGADRADRLDRFRELAASRLGLAQLGDGDAPIEAYRDIYALLDDEIVESLASGGPFASLAFLQDRLDTFAEAWGGATLRLSRAGPLFVGAFTLDERSAANSVRVYG